MRTGYKGPYAAMRRVFAPLMLLGCALGRSPGRNNQVCIVTGAASGVDKAIEIYRTGS